MSAFHGKRGMASFTGLTFEITDFTVNGTAEIVETTVMNVAAVSASTHWKSYVAGYKDWTATCECIEPAAGGGVAALGTSATLTLDSTDGLAYSGTALCTGFSPSSSSKGAGMLSLTFQGNGQLSAA